VSAEPAGPAPGSFARDRFRARRCAWWGRIWWAFPTLAAFEVAVCVGLGALLQPHHLGFYWGLGVGVAVALVMVLADSPPHHIERWRQGFEGEKATARALRRLKRAGWILVDDVDTGRGNIDHLLVGPAGVFLLESKNLHGLLSVERGVLSVRWREDPDDGYENRRLTPRMRALACAVEARLATDGFDEVLVQPVVVLWGAFDQAPLQSKGVAWVRGKELADTLERRPRCLTPEAVQRIGAWLRQSSTAGPRASVP
jgi:Nuclease-related domain